MLALASAAGGCGFLSGRSRRYGRRENREEVVRGFEVSGSFLLLAGGGGSGVNRGREKIDLLLLLHLIEAACRCGWGAAAAGRSLRRARGAADDETLAGAGPRDAKRGSSRGRSGGGARRQLLRLLRLQLLLLLLLLLL